MPRDLANALNAAGQRSGVDFGYLLQTAIRESSLNPSARASTSTATGLFQFLEGTWMEVMKEEGPRLGYQRYADAISVTAEGDYVIADKALRQEILALRENPRIAADLAAAFTRNNGAYLQQRFGRMPSAGELYIAHFLGAKGAETMFTAGLADPEQLATKLFPRQARANPTIFYDDGEPRTIREVYRALVAKHEGAAPANPGFTAQQMTAAAPPSRWPSEPLPSRLGPADMSFESLFADEGAVQPRTHMTPEEETASGAFFTQLYGQQ
ncbi:MAG TPA: transglycosylase SLT domain-containing protein [Devosiaceae bacterium]|nr:transglycosylase SLT domain-containing protein [Devosiaceae bacterium]